MSFVYDKEFVEMLKKTLDLGCLQPCVREKGTNRYLLGEHRKRAYANWPEIEIEVKDDLHRELIILIGNFHRQITEQQTKGRLIRIANILETHGVDKKDICSTMAKLPIPFSEQYIRHLLPTDYKMISKPRPKSEHAQFEFEKHNHIPSIAERTLPLEAGDKYPYPECLCKNCLKRTQCY